MARAFHVLTQLGSPRYTFLMRTKGTGVLWGFTAPLEALQHVRISQHRILAPAGEPKEGCVCAVLLWEAALGFSLGLWVLRAKRKAASPGLTL